MELLFQILSERVVLRDTIATAVLILVVVLLRGAALRFVRQADWTSEEIQLRWAAQVRWASFVLLTLGLVIVWASELRTLALSVVAIAVAVVIAIKELILCISGSVLRVTSGCFKVGDRIEVGGVRGDVVNIGVLTTTILETGPGHRRTGRAVVIPNAMLLDKPVTNETFTDEFVLHLMSVPIGPEEDWKGAEQRLLEAANEVCAPFVEEARRYMDEAARRQGLPGFSVEPSVLIQVPEAGKINLVLRVPTRARDKGIVEQQIVRRFLEPAPGDSASAPS